MVICRSLYKISKDHTWQFNPNFDKNSDLYPPGDFRGGWPQVFHWPLTRELLPNAAGSWLEPPKTRPFSWGLYHHVGGQIVAQPLETGHLVTWSRGMLKIRKECFFSAKIELCQVKGWNHGIFGLGNIHRYFSREKPYQSNGPRFLWSAWSHRASSALLLHMTPMTHREICVHDSSMSYRMKTTQKYVYIIHASYMSTNVHLCVSPLESQEFLNFCAFRHPSGPLSVLTFQTHSLTIPLNGHLWRKLFRNSSPFALTLCRTPPISKDSMPHHHHEPWVVFSVSSSVRPWGFGTTNMISWLVINRIYPTRMTWLKHF